MRFKSSKINGCIIYAITRTNTISFAIDFRGANTKNLWALRWSGLISVIVAVNLWKDIEYLNN